MKSRFTTPITIEKKQVTQDATYGTPVVTWVPLLFDSGTAQGGSANTLTLAESASKVTGIYANHLLQLVTGPGSVQERTVSAYDSATKVATVSPRWRTNFLLRSEEFDNAVWDKNTGVTVTANYAADPDGNITADRVQYDGSGTAGSFRIYQTSGVYDADETVVFSIYLRANVPTTVRLSGNLGTFTICNITATWTRFSIVGTGNPPSVRQFLIYSDAADNNAFDIEVARAQVESVGSLGDYIKTEAAAITLPDATTGYEVDSVAQERFWAEVVDTMPSRSEGVTQGLQVARNQTRLRMRWRDDIDSSMRVTVHKDSDTVFQIVAGPADIGGRKQEIEMVIERFSS